MTFRAKLACDVVAVDHVRTSTKGARVLTWHGATGRGDSTRIVAVLHAPAPEQVAQVHRGAVLGLRGLARLRIEAGAPVLVLHVEAIDWARGAAIEETGRERTHEPS